MCWASGKKGARASTLSGLGPHTPGPVFPVCPEPWEGSAASSLQPSPLHTHAHTVTFSCMKGGLELKHRH